MIYNYLKPKRISDFVISYSWNRYKLEERETKKELFRENFFHFKMLETFRKLEIDFSITFNKFF